MKPHNYVQEVWEERFRIRQAPRPVSRFATGFVLGAAVTGVLVLFGAASTAAINL